RSLVWNADDALLLWELARKCPEGVTCGLCRSQKGLEVLEQYARTLGDLDKPVLLVRPGAEEAAQGAEAKQAPVDEELLKKVLAAFYEKNIVFDKFFFRNPFTSAESVQSMSSAFAACGIAGKIPAGWKIIISQQIPSAGQRVSKIIEKQVLGGTVLDAWRPLLEKMSEAEEKFFGDKSNPLFEWNAETVKKIFGEQGYKVECATKKVTEKRRISQKEISAWFENENSSYGSAIKAAIGADKTAELARFFSSAAQTTIFDWTNETALFVVTQK
ncbi:MAG: recombinase RarA, partial [Treponema sp.]|nr:recombinase RarA [Treponema sp.]